MVAQRSDMHSISRREDSPATQQARAEPSPVELAVLLPLFEGDAAFQRELIDTFRKHGELTITNIREAASRQDTKALSSAAHSLKGAAGEIGADVLARAAAALEYAGRAGGACEALEPFVRAVESELQRVDAFLRGMLDQP